MKKLFVLFAAATLFVGFQACKGQETTEETATEEVTTEAAAETVVADSAAVTTDTAAVAQ